MAQLYLTKLTFGTRHFSPFCFPLLVVLRVLMAVQLINIMFLCNFNDSTRYSKITMLLLFPLILVTNITPSDNKHHKHTGTQVTVKQQLWQQ